MLTVGVLGPVEARRDGVPLAVPAGKTTELLARLALAPGRLVRTDALVEDLWAEPTARNTLQSKASQLRRAIGAKLVVGSAEGYRLELSPDAVDAAQAETLASASARARAADDPVGSLRSALAGLALFRGDVLPGAGDWAAPHRTRLHEVRLGLLDDALAARVDLGAGGEIVAEVQSVIDLHPLREGFWVTLITALYRAGRQADALAAYARVRTLLIAELGVEPGPALQSLEQQVLRQSPRLLAGPARPVTSPGNLPPPVAPGVGRADDIAEVSAALARHRLVTLTGPGGVGKTRLALEVGNRLEAPPGGIWLIRLDGVDATADLFAVSADTLQIVGGRPGLEDRLLGAETVLVLDNCEHLVGPAAHLVQSLLDAVPRLRILATSQALLGLGEEHHHEVPPLSHHDSVTLFARRAAEQRRQFVMDDEISNAVWEVCRSLDGLPLAIELAAARVRSLSIPEIARRLDDRFALVRNPSSTLPERRRALAGAIAWSYDLLFPDDQRTLWALSCFAGSASLGGVEHVLAALGVPAEILPDTIARLVDRSLVSIDGAAGGEVRYRLLDSIRLFAADRLEREGAAGPAFAAHAGWYAELATWCDANVRSTRQPACLAIARAERANIDSAMTWCAVHDPLLGARIANGFGWTWVVLGDGTAGAARVRNTLTASSPPRVRTTGLLLASWLEASAGNVEVAQRDLDGARELVAEPGADRDDDVILADVDRHQAFLAIQQGRPELVRRSAAAALVRYRSCAMDWSAAAALLLAAYGSIMIGDTGAASRDAGEALELLGPIGDPWGLVHAQAMLGAIAQAEHRFADADRALEAAADQSVVMGFPGQAALHRATLARVRHRAGDARAAASYDQALQAAAACGDGRLAATARVNLARLRRADGDTPGAVALLEENERWYAAAGGGDYALLTRCLLAATRDDEAALAPVLAEARAVGSVEVTVHALDALARLASAGDAATARTLLAEADSLAPQVAHTLDDADRTDADAVRATLGC